MNVFFITGTDTDSGKTTVSAAILAYLAERQKRALGLKPIASGCYWQEGRWRSSDAEILASHSAVCARPSPWRYQEPIAPHIAADKEGRAIELDALKTYIDSHDKLGLDYLLVEGAGGLLVPLSLAARTTWRDLIRILDLPVIVVVGLKLGCINHALLTLDALELANVPVAGWFANHLTPDFSYAKENVAAIAALTNAPLLGICRYGGALVLSDAGRQCFS